MDMVRRNIVYIGSDSYYKDDLKLCYLNDKMDNRYFNLIKINTLEELGRKQGFLLILTMDELYDYCKDVVDTFEPDVYEIDRYFRKIFKNFCYVIVISIEEFDYGHIPFSNIYVEFANKYFDTNEGLNLLIDKLYVEYVSRKNLKFSKIRLANIERLRNYIRRKNVFVTTKEIMKDLNVNEKWIQRYMRDMNSIYNNIGYNKRNRVWYVVKNNYKN